MVAITLGTVSSSTVLRLPYEAGYVFSACATGVSPTMSAPCDPGALAFDAEEGDLSSYVTISPAGVSLEVPIGTRARIQYTVLDNGTPRLSANAYRTVEIVSPCLAREFFCDGECKQVCSMCVLHTHLAKLVVYIFPTSTYSSSSEAIYLDSMCSDFRFQTAARWVHTAT